MRKPTNPEGYQLNNAKNLKKYKIKALKYNNQTKIYLLNRMNALNKINRNKRDEGQKDSGKIWRPDFTYKENRVKTNNQDLSRVKKPRLMYPSNTRFIYGLERFFLYNEF